MKFISSIRKGEYVDAGLLILRLGLGAMFLYHGLPKIFGGPTMWSQIGMAMGNYGVTFAPLFWGLMAALAEGLGGLLLLLGLFSRVALVFMVIDMIVAATYHLVTPGQGFAMASHAIEVGIAFLGLIFIGPGKYTMINLFHSRK